MQFVKDFIMKGHLYCETENGTCESVASDMCKYMNDCYGNGSCNSYGKCECKSGYYGADCSTTVTNLSSASGNKDSQSVTASRWYYYKVPAGSGDFTFTVSSDRDVSLYVRKGDTDLPDTVTFDAVVKDDTSITLNSALLGSSAGQNGAILAIHCVGQPEDTTNFEVSLTLSSDGKVEFLN